MFRRRTAAAGAVATSASAVFAVSAAVLASSSRGLSFMQQIKHSGPAPVASDELLRGVREQFWRPVMVQAEHGRPDDVSRYRIADHLRRMIDGSTVPPPRFSWAGVASNEPQLVEDVLFFLTAGFDIKHVDVSDAHRCSFLVKHSRSFLGWKPPVTQLPPGDPSAATTKAVQPSAATESVKRQTLITIPFTMDVTANPTPRNSFQAVKFSWDLGDALVSHAVVSGIAPPPREVLDCLQDMEAVRMVTALRKSGVSGDVISWRALRSATKKTSTWASALGVM